MIAALLLLTVTPERVSAGKIHQRTQIDRRRPGFGYWRLKEGSGTEWAAGASLTARCAQKAGYAGDPKRGCVNSVNSG